MADKIKKIKADKKEANKQAKLAQEEKDRPKIEQLQLLWNRFALARAQAKKTVKATYEAAGMYYGCNTGNEVQQLENGETKITTNTNTPYGYGVTRWGAESLVAIANLFGCSIDYLLGRTDIMEVAQTAPPTEKVSESGTGQGNIEIVPLQWLPGQESPRTNLRALTKFNMKDGYPPVEVTAYWRGENWQFKDGVVIDGQCLGWFPLPPKESTSTQALNSGCKTGMSPSGHCGAAAYCSEPVDCCLNCDKECNGRCGWLDGLEVAE